ncbi:hypothetical protein ACQPZJ_22245 [Actinoplanes sp. CA-054009]
MPEAGESGNWLSRVLDNGILQNLVASAIWVGIAAIAIYLVNRRRLRRWWGISEPRGSIIRFITGTVGPMTTQLGYSYSVTTLSDASGVAHVTAGVTLAYGRKYRIRTHSSDRFHDAFWEDVVVLIGGRVRNSATRDLIERVERDWDLRFGVEDGSDLPTRSVVDRVDGTRYEASFDSERRITKDYALLCRLPNPYSPHDGLPVFVFYGLHAFGILGAAKTVAPEYITRLTRIYVKGSPWCQFLIAVDVHDEETYPEIISCASVRRKFPANEFTLR